MGREEDDQGRLEEKERKKMREKTEEKRMRYLEEGGEKERKTETKRRGKVWRSWGLLDLRYCFLSHWEDENWILAESSLRALVFRAGTRIILMVVLPEERLLHV